MIDIIHENMFNAGYHRLNDNEVFIHLKDLDSCEWKNWRGQGLQLIKRTPEIEDAIHKTQLLLADKYVKHLDENYKLGGDCEIVNGMDDATLSWHNDNVEGYNLCILLYLDTLDSDIGGMTRFRNIHTKELTGEFYPQQYDVSFMNHCSRFEHVVTPMILPMNRRVALFNFNINGILVG